MASEHTNRIQQHVADAHRAGRAILLDGATGTELERRGVSCGLPLWSTHGLVDAPETVAAIHAAYAEAACDAITAATFRTQRRTLARANRADDAAALTRLAVDLARQGAPGRPVLGSAPPLEDCYRPDLTPETSSLEREHAEHAAHLAAAGVDAILVETHPTVREAREATRAAAGVGLPALASLVCDAEGRLLSGEELGPALDAVAEAGAIAAGVNCLPPHAVAGCLPALRGCGLPFLVSANLGAPLADGRGARSDDATPEEFAAHGTESWRAGATLVGGCCGTTPDHLRALAVELERRGARGDPTGN